MDRKLKIALGADHAGFPLKETIRGYLLSKGYEVEDHGASSAQSVDYPDFAERVAKRVASGSADSGVLICGTGLGMELAANKVSGIRATPCNDTLSAQFARSHNNANVLTLGARLVDEATARKILDVWFSTAFEGGRHERRIEKIAAIDQREHRERKP